jgi:nitrate/nitrite transport system substrate-binding protein
MRKPATRTQRSSFSRRQFLKASGLAALYAHLPVGWAGRVFASDAPETTQLRIGIIALTDCSSIVIAYEKGFFKEHGLDVTVSKEASWAVIRDKLQLGENQATHMLYGMPYASTMGLFGAPVKPMIIPWVLNYNGQAITLNNDLRDKGVRAPADLKKLLDEEKAAGKPPRTFAMMDGFCVGEPWNARAIADGIGFTVTTTQALWRNHPEKVCAFTAEFAEKNPKTVKAVLKALHQASVFIDKLENRPEVAEIVSRPAYINCPKEIILGRMLGKYDHGDGKGEHEDQDYMRFFDRGVNFPWKSHGVWWLTQFRRWGMVKDTPDYQRIVNQVHRPDIYREVAKEMGIDVPSEDFKTEQLFDGLSFDPAKPDEYAKAFAVNNMIEV